LSHLILSFFAITDSFKGKEKLQSSDLRPSKYKKLDMLRDVFDRSELLMGNLNSIQWFQQASKCESIADQSEYQFKDGATNRFLDDQSLRAEAAMAAAAVSLPPAIAPEHCLGLVPLNESVLAYREGSLIDLGLFNGRRFRVGWAPNRINICVDTKDSAEKLRTATQVQLNVLGAEQSEQQAVRIALTFLPPNLFIYFSRPMSTCSNTTCACRRSKRAKDSVQK
jgi:hypothetical protein